MVPLSKKNTFRDLFQLLQSLWGKINRQGELVDIETAKTQRTTVVKEFTAHVHITSRKIFLLDHPVIARLAMELSFWHERPAFQWSAFACWQ